MQVKLPNRIVDYFSVIGECSHEARFTCSCDLGTEFSALGKSEEIFDSGTLQCVAAAA
jgi:hypothetical protein